MSDYVKHARHLIEGFAVSDPSLWPVLSEIDLVLQRHQESQDDATQRIDAALRLRDKPGAGKEHVLAALEPIVHRVVRGHEPSSAWPQKSADALMGSVGESVAAIGSIQTSIHSSTDRSES